MGQLRKRADCKSQSWDICMLPRRKSQHLWSRTRVGLLPNACAGWQAHLYAKACDNLPTEGVFKELFLGIRTIPDVPLPKGLFCLRSQPQHQLSMLMASCLWCAMGTTWFHVNDTVHTQKDEVKALLLVFFSQIIRWDRFLLGENQSWCKGCW